MRIISPKDDCIELLVVLQKQRVVGWYTRPHTLSHQSKHVWLKKTKHKDLHGAFNLANMLATVYPFPRWFPTKPCNTWIRVQHQPTVASTSAFSCSGSRSLPTSWSTSLVSTMTIPASMRTTWQRFFRCGEYMSTWRLHKAFRTHAFGGLIWSTSQQSIQVALVQGALNNSPSWRLESISKKTSQLIMLKIHAPSFFKKTWKVAYHDYHGIPTLFILIIFVSFWIHHRDSSPRARIGDWSLRRRRAPLGVSICTSPHAELNSQCLPRTKVALVWNIV